MVRLRFIFCITVLAVGTIGMFLDVILPPPCGSAISWESDATATPKDLVPVCGITIQGSPFMVIAGLIGTIWFRPKSVGHHR